MLDDIIWFHGSLIKGLNESLICAAILCNMYSLN